MAWAKSWWLREPETYSLERIESDPSRGKTGKKSDLDMSVKSVSSVKTTSYIQQHPPHTQALQISSEISEFLAHKRALAEKKLEDSPSSKSRRFQAPAVFLPDPKLHPNSMPSSSWEKFQLWL